MNNTQKLIGLALVSILLAACATVPFTGRRQTKLLPESTLAQKALTQYTDFLKENQVSKNSRNTQLVKEVGTNIRIAVEKYYAEKGWSDKLKEYKWEINLVEDPTVNAWAMPGLSLIHI